MSLAAEPQLRSDPAAIARAFVEARREARALPDFPGVIPSDLASAYAIQDAAIQFYGDEIAGWKVGRIAPELQDRFGAERLAGPIFKPNVHSAAERVRAPVFIGGFAAVEAEYLFRLDQDIPGDKLDWSYDEVAALEGDLMIGVEMAGSPLATINALGPAVVVSDFGNNASLIVGPPVRDWRSRSDALTCATLIDGEVVGRGGAASIPGGPLEAVRFLLENVARRGRPLRAGQLVSTGAATGIHDITAGRSARVDFGPDGVIELETVPAAA
jgi:2-keto-4-pentenoate hydratase